MLRSYLKISLRNIRKYKGYSFINITGLSIGMCCAILILLWVKDEISYDKFHKNSDNIYRVLENQFYAGGEIFPVAVTPSPLAPALKEEFPEIENTSRFRDIYWNIKLKEETISEKISFIDPGFFEIFTVEFIKGESSQVFTDLNSIVLTEEMASKYFGEENPIGKILTLKNKHDFKVTGVVKKFPDNSHIKFNFLVPFNFLKNDGQDLTRWGSNWIYTYIKLRDQFPYKELDKKILDFLKKHNENSSTQLHLQPLNKIHLYSAGKYVADINGHGDIAYVRIFIIVAFFILVIGCINFMNLSTARSARRAKEIGMRKVVGARRFKIITQFLCESISMAFIALVVAVMLVAAFLPAFNNLTSKNISIQHFNGAFLFYTLLIVTITGLVSGSYPAFFLSSFKAVRVLKGPLKTGGTSFRRVLVIFQFALSIILIICTIVITGQLDFMRNKKLGLNKDNIYYFWFGDVFRDQIETARHQLLTNSNISSITTSNQNPAHIYNSSSGGEWEGKDPETKILFHTAYVDPDYEKTFKMEMAKGRFFSVKFQSDTNSIVLNEKAIEVMGLKDPIGKKMTFGGKDHVIIGIIKNFHFKTVKTKIEPFLMRYNPIRNRAMFLRVNSSNVEETLRFIEKTYKKFSPDSPFDGRFLDEVYESLYRNERKISEIFRYFSILAIIISCLGLFGLASFMAEQRTKEIGVRKALGASVYGIVLLLSRNFSMWVIIANCFAWPVAWYAMNKWLLNFAYRIELEWWYFLSSGILAIVISMLTVSYQALKAASLNPTETLRYE